MATIPEKKSSDGLIIRKAIIEDTIRITEIYNQAILDGNCTCDMETFTVEDRIPWVEGHLNDKYPLYVAEVNGYVVGYGYLSEYRFGRPAVACTAEISYYFDFSFHGHGYGSEMMNYLILMSQKLGYENLVAILMGSNKKSVRLLRKFGFDLWGTIPNAVHILNNITDHVYYGKQLTSRI